jgi:hypothetical protein
MLPVYFSKDVATAEVVVVKIIDLDESDTLDLVTPIPTASSCKVAALEI